MEAWITNYLTYLRLQKQEPTKEFLIKLYQQHLAYVPYELTSKFMYSLEKDYIPTIEKFVDHLIHRGFGGNCYILNINFFRLLRTLGYKGYLVKINPGHLGIIVSIRNKNYFVDVGYGSPLNQLVELKNEDWHGEILGEEIFFTYKADNLITYDRLYKGKMIVSKEIELNPLKEIDFETDIKASYEDSDTNPFMRRISMARMTGDKYVWVRNNQIMVRETGIEKQIELENIEEWSNYIHKEFYIKREDLQSTIDFLYQRNVSLGFKDK